MDSGMNNFFGLKNLGGIYRYGLMEDKFLDLGKWGTGGSNF